MKGTVIWFAPFKNFGFIYGEDGNNLFIHSTAVAKGSKVNVDDLVEYTTEESKHGQKAKNVKTYNTPN